MYVTFFVANDGLNVLSLNTVFKEVFFEKPTRHLFLGARSFSREWKRFMPKMNITFLITN